MSQPMRVLDPDEAAALADKIMDAENHSGVYPIEFKVLVLPLEVEEKTASGIVLAMQVTEREKQKQVRGKLIAVGGNAFQDWADPIPEVGDTVMFAKFVGYITPGDDGLIYRIMNDKDITAILSK